MLGAGSSLFLSNVACAAYSLKIDTNPSGLSTGSSTGVAVTAVSLPMGSLPALVSNPVEMFSCDTDATRHQ